MRNAGSLGGRRRPHATRPSVLALEGRTLLTASPRVDTFAVPILSAGPGQIIDGPDGDLWYTGATGTIDRITTAGQVTEFSLPMPSGGVTPNIGGLTAGPDGAVWAVDASNNQLDRIAHDGQIETYPLPAGQVETEANGPGSIDSWPIVAGADGNLWFATNSSTTTTPGTIDRITPQGVITTFSLPLGDAGAESLAASPDGVWFTDPAANRVGEVDASGHFVEYAAPSPSVAQEDGGMGLAVGPDGDVYYITLGEYQSLVKVAPGGATEQVFAPGSPTLANLLTGPGGVYFEYAASDDSTLFLDRLAPDGTLTTVMTDAPGAASMAFGPDGNLWLAGPLGVSRVVLNPSTPMLGPSLVIAGAPGSLGTATSPVVAVGEAASTPMAIFANSADVTVDSATIDWGDGSKPTAGTLVSTSDPYSATSTGGGEITGSHAYAQAGSYRVTVTIQGTGPGAAAMTASTVETVSAVAPTPSLQSSTSLQAGQSIPLQGSILFFTTPTTLDGAPSDFTATVDWGDGSKPTAGTVVGGQGPASTFIPFPGTPTNVFEVSGGHTYATAGSYTIQVTLTDAFGQVSTESTPIEVFPGRLGLSLTPPTNLTAGPPPFVVAYNGLNGINLGSLADFLGTTATGNDTVTIDWGDGSAATVQTDALPSSGFGEGPTSTAASFGIVSTHEYAKPGDYTVTISAADPQGDQIEATTTANVAPAPLSVAQEPTQWGSDPYYSTSGQTAMGLLSLISPPDSTDPASDFSATVDWGDGSAVTTGTVGTAPALASGGFADPAAGQLEVSGDHTLRKCRFIPGDGHRQRPRQLDRRFHRDRHGGAGERPKRVARDADLRPHGRRGEQSGRHRDFHAPEPDRAGVRLQSDGRLGRRLAHRAGDDPTHRAGLLQ